MLRVLCFEVFEVRRGFVLFGKKKKKRWDWEIYLLGFWGIDFLSCGRWVGR